jgi:hypothetical protein
MSPQAGTHFSVMAEIRTAKGAGYIFSELLDTLDGHGWLVVVKDF